MQKEYEETTPNSVFKIHLCILILKIQWEVRGQMTPKTPTENHW